MSSPPANKRPKTDAVAIRDFPSTLNLDPGFGTGENGERACFGCEAVSGEEDDDLDPRECKSCNVTLCKQCITQGLCETCRDNLVLPSEALETLRRAVTKAGFDNIRAFAASLDYVIKDRSDAAEKAKAKNTKRAAEDEDEDEDDENDDE